MPATSTWRSPYRLRRSRTSALVFLLPADRPGEPREAMRNFTVNSRKPLLTKMQELVRVQLRAKGINMHDDTDDELPALSPEEKKTLALAQLSTAQLRALPMRKLSRVYEFVTDVVTKQYVDEDTWRKVTDVGIARHVDRLPERKLSTRITFKE